MSRDELTNMAESDDLSRQLEAAGRRAERALPRDPAREQEIVGRLRTQLLGETAELGDAEHDHQLIALRPIVRTRLPRMRFSRSLAAGLAACLVVVSLAAAASGWLPRPAPAPSLEATTSPSSTATLAPAVEPMPPSSSTPWLSDAATPSPIESTSPSAGPTPTPTPEPTLRPPAPQPTLKPAPTPTPAPTPAPTPTPVVTPVPVDMGPLNVTANPNGTYTITWNAYTGPLAFGGYALCYTTNENATFGYVEGFGGVISIGKTTNTWTGTFPWPATLRVKVEALYWPPSSRAQKAGETQVTIIPYTAPTPTPTPTPTPPPVVNLGDFVAVQDNGDGTFTFSWTPYSGPLSVFHVVSGTTTASSGFGYAEGVYDWVHSAPSATWTGPITPGSWRIKVEAISTSTGTAIKAAETNIYPYTFP